MRFSTLPFKIPMKCSSLRQRKSGLFAKKKKTQTSTARVVVFCVAYLTINMEYFAEEKQISDVSAVSCTADKKTPEPLLIGSHLCVPCQAEKSKTATMFR